MKVQDILNQKGHEIVTTLPTTTVQDTASLLVAKGIGAVIVSEDGWAVDGLFSERDIVKFISNQGAESLGLPVERFMVQNPYVCASEDDVIDVMKSMTLRRARHVPVVDQGRLSGIISIGDVVKSRLNDMQLEVNVLRDYAIASR